MLRKKITPIVAFTEVGKLRNCKSLGSECPDIKDIVLELPLCEFSRSQKEISDGETSAFKTALFSDPISDSV